MAGDQKPLGMPNTTCREIVTIVFAAFLCGSGQAAVRHVPGDYSGIQSAIDNCNHGDVILVSPGVYYENVNFHGKAITLSSTNPADLNVASNTVIDASGQGSAVTFASGETTNSILTGFTITGGYGTVNAATNFYYGALNGKLTNYYGAGIFCYRASPTILGNIITANVAPEESARDVGIGGGIGCIESDALITRNLITANTAGMAGGIYVYRGRARVVSNLICSNGAEYGGGAGLFRGGYLANNTLAGNSAVFTGNVFAKSDAIGQCLVTGNIICNATSAGGIHVESEDTITQLAFNDVWNNTGGDYFAGPNRTGLNGNISQDPQFVDASNDDFRLQDTSPCIDAGDPNFQNAANESDFYGSPRVYAGRVDIGAAEWFDDSLPFAEAGPDQVVTVTALPALLSLDGSGSSDPHGAALSYYWSQISGSPGTFSNAWVAQPTFYASALGTYQFELVVSNGSLGSLPDTVRVTVTNQVPTADAGDRQVHFDLGAITSITMDGSRSSDAEQIPLSYHWKQIGGWQVSLSDTNAVNPTFVPAWLGTYLFELVVNDGLQDSPPDVVEIVIGPNHAPVADAGSSRYVASGNVMLDGTRSYDPDGYGTLTYQWRRVSGPAVTITGANTSKPVVSGFTPGSVIQQCVFELVVSDGDLVSSPSQVTVTIVPNFGGNALILTNPPFNPAQPTILAFGGGNCATGTGMTFEGAWLERANWITVNSYDTDYSKYGNMLIVYLSSVAPDYRQPIQTMGFSTGGKPAMEVARHVNTTYRDPRYAVNRVALLDPVCSDLSSQVTQYNANRVSGEQGWVDNYASNSNYGEAAVLAGALNVVCLPGQNHVYARDTYADSGLNYANGGLVARGPLSVIGSCKNYQLNTTSQKYYFKVPSTGGIVFYNQSLYPGKILAPVELSGPADGDTLATGGAVFSCQPVENAVGYQLLFGTDPYRVMDFSVVSDTPNPPSQIITTLPLEHTWWTVRAYDQFGSTIYADPRLINRPENRSPVADAGADQVLYAGLDGKATVVLDGSASIDPEGETLGYTWAWAIGATTYQSNGVNLTLDLPVGAHPIQLVVNDGHVDSLGDQVLVTVQPLPPPLPTLTCSLADNWVTLSWPTNAADFTLVTASALAANAVWSPVDMPVVVSNDENRVSVPATNAYQFFRLRR